MAEPLRGGCGLMTGRLLILLGSTVILIAALILVVGNTVANVTAPPWGNSTGFERSAEVAGDTVVGQQFVAPFPGLHQIEVGLDPALVRTAQPLTFHLKVDSPATEDLWTSDLSTDGIQEGKPYTFEFPPLRDSAGQTYYFYLQSTGSTPGDAITIGYDPNSFLDDSSAFVDGQPVEGNLQFQTFYTIGTGDKVDLLLTRMTEDRPYILGNRGFYIDLVVVYVLLLGAFLWQTARVIRKKERA